MFYLNNIISIVFFIFFYCLIEAKENDEIFKTDIGDQMKIGISDKGYKSVQLKCGSNSMLINLETDKDFDGVIYTRGNFYDKDSPCFLDPEPNRNKRSFSLKFPLNKCNTKKKGQVYSNILVLQHDKELIMPGDAAFNLECDYNRPRDVTVNANLQNENAVVSRISLTDADPGFKETSSKKKRSIESYSNTVILTQEFLKQRKQYAL